jgi:hypothetical protein
MNFENENEILTRDGFFNLTTSSEAEEGIQMVRFVRDGLLQNSDKYMVIDFPITEEKREEWKVYRGLLRNITGNLETSGFRIFEIEGKIGVYKEGFSWPTPPSD